MISDHVHEQIINFLNQPFSKQISPLDTLTTWDYLSIGLLSDIHYQC